MANAVRNIQDLLLVKTTALPTGASTVNGASIDLGSVDPGLMGEQTRVYLAVPTLTGVLTGAHTETFTLQDSADDSSFAAIVGCDTVAALGSAPGAIAKDWRLPPTTRRYIRASVLGGAAAEDCSAISMTLTVRG